MLKMSRDPEPQLETRDAPVSALSIQQLRAIFQGQGVASGIQVNEDRALSLSGVYAAVNLLSSVIASLELRTYRRTDRGKVVVTDRPAARVLIDPCPQLTDFSFRRSLVFAAVTSGNGYAHIERSIPGDPIALHLLNWRTVEPKRRRDGSIWYKIRGVGEPVPAEDIIHISALSWDGIKGISPVSVCRETLGVGLATERYAASVFGNGAQASGLLKVKGDLSDEAAKNLRESWQAIHGGPDNYHRTAVLEEGIDWVQTSFSPEDAQLLSSRTFTINEIARIFGVPVNLLHEASQGSYNSNEEANTQWYQTSVRSWLENIEAELDKKLLTREERLNGYFCEHRFESLLRGNLQTRAAYFSTLFNIGCITQNEVRESEGLNPVEGGDRLFVPVNLQQPAEQPAAEQPAETPVETTTDTADPIREALVEVVRDVAGRIVRRELAAISKNRARIESDWTREYFEEHRSFVKDAIKPALSAWARYTKTYPDPDSLAREWADRSFALVVEDPDRYLEGEHAEDLTSLLTR